MNLKQVVERINARTGVPKSIIYIGTAYVAMFLLGQVVLRMAATSAHGSADQKPSGV